MVAKRGHFDEVSPQDANTGNRPVTARTIAPVAQIPRKRLFHVENASFFFIFRWRSRFALASCAGAPKRRQILDRTPIYVRRREGFLKQYTFLELRL